MNSGYDDSPYQSDVVVDWLRSAGTKRALKKMCTHGRVQVTQYLSPYHHVHDTYTFNKQVHVMDLVKGTFASVRALVGA